MKVLDLCDQYFLILMVILGLIVTIVDSYTFKKNGKVNIGKKAKVLGVCAVSISVVLFILRSIF